MVNTAFWTLEDGFTVHRKGGGGGGGGEERERERETGEWSMWMRVRMRVYGSVREGSVEVREEWDSRNRNADQTKARDTVTARHSVVCGWWVGVYVREMTVRENWLLVCNEPTTLLATVQVSVPVSPDTR